MKRPQGKYFVSLTIALLLFIGVFAFFGIMYPNHLVQKEQMQMFLTDCDYLFLHLSYPGGFAIYLGQWATQFFIYPWSGAFIISLVIVSVYLGVQQIIRQLFDIPFSILAILPAAGYFFLLMNDFYTLSGAVAFSMCVWMISAYTAFESIFKRRVFALIAAVIIYWLAGGVYIPFIACIVMKELICKYYDGNKHYINTVVFITVFIFSGVLIPLLVRHYLVTNTVLQSYFSPVFYKFIIKVPASVFLLLASVPLIVLLHLFFDYYRKVFRVLQYVLVISITVIIGYGLVKIPDYAEENEMMYDNLTRHQQWHQIITLAEKNQPEGTQGRLALTLALGQTNQLGNRLLAFNIKKSDFFIPYKLHGMAPLISSEPYYYLGLINFAQMLSMESIGSSPDVNMPVRAVKRYVETCIITGQYDVAARFLRYLEKTFYYRKWAKNAESYLHNDEKVNLHPVWGKLRAQQIKDLYYFNFNQPGQAYFYLLRSNPQNKMAFQYLMMSFLLQKDLENFMKFMPLFKDMGEPELPLVYQESLAFLETQLPALPQPLTSFHIDSDVRNRLGSYAKAFKAGGKNKEMMKRLFGNTFWYYLHFSTSDEK